MTKPKPPSCEQALMNPPAAYSSFATTEPEAYLWFYVTDLRAGDRVATEYFTPSGTVYSAVSGPFDPVETAGDWCFTDTRFQIAGALPALNPGQWTVKVTLNGAPFFSLSFTIGSTTSRSGGSGSTGTAIPSTNQIRNGDAESGAASENCSGLASISGWTTDGKVSVCRYGTGDYLARTSPGPPDRGNNFFTGGNSASAGMHQIIDLAPYAGQVDAGALPFTLSGWLGGYSSQNDQVKVSAIFKSATGATLGIATIGPVLAAERGNVSGLIFKTASGTVPAEARSISVEVSFTRTAGTANDGYADNLSLTFTSGSGTSGSFRVTADEVDSTACPNIKITVAVTDSNGAAVENLPASAFALKEGGQDRTISVTAATASPFAPRNRYIIGYTSGNPAADAQVEITVTSGGLSGSVTRSVPRCQAAPPPPACTYSVTPSSSVPAAGGTGTIQVTTAAGCAWSAVSNASWITITSGSSGSGSGTVSYRAAANTGTAGRTGTLTIGGQTHTVTQAGACSYSLGSMTVDVGAAGGTTAVLVTTGSGCAWSVTSNASWITVSSGATGTGNGTVNLSVAPNTTNSARTGTVTIAGLTLTVTQARPAQAGVPAISAGGILNAASYTPASLPAGAIARGAFFSIFGSDLGPARPVQATSYPIETSLADVSVKVSQGSRSVQALPVFVSAAQINAVMPSNAPAGEVEVTVTYRKTPSAPVKIRVVDSNFGAFSVAGGRGPGIIQNYISASEQPLNTRSAAARPRQVVTLWGTGLGPISAPDNMAPPAGDLPFPVEITVGGKPARKLYAGRAPCCAGVDQIVFELPEDAPQGCYIPVQVKAGSTYSNVVTMAIEANGGPCQDTHNPVAGIAANGGNLGVVILGRAQASLALETGKPPTDLLLDLGVGAFQSMPAGGDLGFNPLLSFPTPGTCQSYSGNLDLGAVLGAGTNVEDKNGWTGRALDAGPQLMVTGPSGTAMPLARTDEDATTGPYAGLLGGVLPIGEGLSLPPFLNGGDYTIRGPGGRDVGPFSVTLNIPPPIRWTNRSQITQVNRSNGLTVTWSGGTASQLVAIGGASSDQKNKAAAGFFCFVPATPGSFTVPPSVLGNLPPSVGSDAQQSLGALLVGTIPAAPYTTFQASGLDTGLVIYLTGDISTVAYQ